VQILTGCVPFSEISNQFALVMAIANGQRPPFNPSSRQGELYNDLWSLAAACWDAIPANRPTADRIETLVAEVRSEDHSKPRTLVRPEFPGDKILDAFRMKRGVFPSLTAAAPADGPIAPVVPGVAKPRIQTMSVPSDFVDCILGDSGATITHIRRQSGSEISISKTPRDGTRETVITIAGLQDQNDRALFMLFNQVEEEKARRGQVEVS